MDRYVRSCRNRSYLVRNFHIFEYGLQILKIYINESFSVPLMKSNSAVLCLALSTTKRKLAIVNEEKQCIVYDVVLDQIIYQVKVCIAIAYRRVDTILRKFRFRSRTRSARRGMRCTKICFAIPATTIR